MCMKPKGYTGCGFPNLSKKYRCVMCIQLGQTGALCVYSSIDDSIGMNRS